MDLKEAYEKRRQEVLSLPDLGFVSVNRVKRIVGGFFSGQLDP